MGYNDQESVSLFVVDVFVSPFEQKIVDRARQTKEGRGEWEWGADGRSESTTSKSALPGLPSCCTFSLLLWSHCSEFTPFFCLSALWFVALAQTSFVSTSGQKLCRAPQMTAGASTLLLLPLLIF